MPHTVQVAVDGAAFHFDKLYTYLVPERLAGRVYPGSMVLVPFGRGSRARMAVVLACAGLVWVLTGIAGETAAVGMCALVLLAGSAGLYSWLRTGGVKRFRELI